MVQKDGCKECRDVGWEEGKEVGKEGKEQIGDEIQFWNQRNRDF